MSDIRVPEGGKPVKDMDWDDLLLSGVSSVGKDKRDRYPTASEQWEMIEALDPEEFEYVPSLPEQALDYIATPTGAAITASMVSANPLWFIPDVGSAVNDANQVIRSKLPTGVKKYWPETGDPWDLLDIDVSLIPTNKLRDMQNNPEEYAE